MGQDLKHLALVMDDTLPVAGDLPSGAWVDGIVDHFTRLALFCLEELPDTPCLSFFYPELQNVLLSREGRLLSPDTFAAAMAGADEAFAGMNAGLAFLGFPRLLPPGWSPLLRTSPRRSSSRRVRFYLGYSGKEEIVQAAEELIAHGATTLEDNDLDSCLLSRGQPDPDLIVFSSLVFTPRDFMIWQASYAEIWHVSTPGTACTGEDIRSALTSYGERERRFGRV